MKQAHVRWFALSALLPLAFLPVVPLVGFSVGGCCSGPNGCRPDSATTGIRGRVLKGSGGCGALPPDGVCPTPVHYAPYPGGRFTVYDSTGQNVRAHIAANAAGEFTASVPSGTYYVAPDNGFRSIGQTVVVPTAGHAEIEVRDYVPPP
jgi:hypothetical protein